MFWVCDLGYNNNDDDDVRFLGDPKDRLGGMSIRKACMIDSDTRISLELEID